MIEVVHFKKEPNCEYIGRPSPLGNPYPLKKGEIKGSTLPRYKEWLLTKIKKKDKEVCAEMNRLFLIAINGDLKIGCWCSPHPCHGDVIKEILEDKLFEYQSKKKTKKASN